ncbi:MAG: cell division protein FtsW [Actinomycetota bacterium]|nr:cell division protein FtsW [Actinomycetota bacterium]
MATTAGVGGRTRRTTRGGAPLRADGTVPGADSTGVEWLSRLESPLAAYYLVLGSSVALTALGLVMVLSSSSVEAVRDTGSSFSVFAKQALFAVLGLPLAWAASRAPLRLWTRLAWPAMGVGFLGLLLVLSPLGDTVQGNRNWLPVGPVAIQPSEAAKLALVIWISTVLTCKRPLLHVPAHALVPVLPAACLMLGLVLLGHDLGTALVMMALVGALLFFAGVPLRLFALAGGLAGAASLLLVWTSPNRMGRVGDWLSGSGCNDYYGSCWQAIHGKWALASGGWWGVGLGSSREKWSWLPAAHNDFIFAIIGEELGLVGTLAVLTLFALLGIGMLKLVLSTDDFFVKVATGGVLAWILGQALVNIGAVLGVLPVIGVPLPLVSYGGSALMMTLVALGMVLGFARQLPGASEALASRPSVVKRSLAVLPGRRDGGVR